MDIKTDVPPSNPIRKQILGLETKESSLPHQRQLTSSSVGQLIDFHHLVHNDSYPRLNSVHPLPVMASDGYLDTSFGKSQYHELQKPVGLGIQYDNVEHQQQGFCSLNGHRYHTNSPFVQVPLISSPPTPMSHQSDTRRTRSGRSMARKDSPHSSHNRSPAPPLRSARKKRSTNGEKNKTPRLTAPLSLLTKDMRTVPVRDMEKWVNRSTEDRLKEVSKRNGYITRPMNSFMLYRSAYAERTKMWCLHNNHQVVSSVSGESWPLEPPDVREFYNELAKTERMNHQKAHPNYKFSPSKPGVTTSSSNKRKKTHFEYESEPSDVEDSDWASASGVHQRLAKRPGRDAGFPARFHLDNASQHLHKPLNRAPWSQSVHLPPTDVMLYPQMQHPQHFYPSPTMQQHHMQMMPQHPDPFAASFDTVPFGSGQSLIGLPGQSHSELFGLYSDLQTPILEHQYDPELLAFDDRDHSQGLGVEAGLVPTQHTEYVANSDQQFGEQAATSLHSLTTSEIGGPLITEYRPKEWQPESQSPSFDHGITEFDNLWTENELLQDRIISAVDEVEGVEECLEIPKSD